MNPCSICSHPMHHQIDIELVSGRAVAKIAKEFGVEYHSLYAHSTKHLAKNMTQAIEKQQTAEQFDLLDRIDLIIKRAEAIYLRSFAKGADVTALKALDSQRSTFELIAKVSYSIAQARIAQADLLRQQSGEGNVEEQYKFQQNLSILSLEELKVFQLISQKLQTQDKTINCLAVTAPEFSRDNSKASTYTPFEEELPDSGEESAEEEEKGTTLLHKVQVRPIVGKEIPSSDRESNSVLRLPRR